jgi:tetratricopeptide (TPR) repeat protein
MTSAENEFQIALSFHTQHQLTQAEEHYRRALEFRADHLNALKNLGLLLFERNLIIEALEITRRAAELDPSCAETQSNIGKMLGTAGDHVRSCIHFEKALAIDPANTRTLARFARELHDHGRDAETIPFLRKAIQHRQSDPQLHEMLGALFHALGHFEEAQQCLEKTVSLAPNGHRYRDLAMMTKFSPGNPHIASMERLIQNKHLPATEKMALHFALGKAYYDLLDIDLSFEHQLAANRLRRSSIVYDEAHALSQMRRLQNVSADFLRTKASFGNASDSPIFIVGMPRSGSTLIEQILASHPQIGTLGETLAFENSVRGILGTIDPARSTLAVQPEQLRSIAAAYLASTARVRGQEKRIVDKMLPNFLYAGLIHVVFPNARIIHSVRDPIDTCLSCFSTEFPAGAPYLYNLTELGRYYKAYAATMRHWSAVLPPGILLEVRYEDLVSAPEQHARRLVQHCGLDWNPACLDFYKTERAVWTASAAQVRKPIYTNSLKRTLPRGDLVAPLLAAFHETMWQDQPE